MSPAIECLQISLTLMKYLIHSLSQTFFFLFLFLTSAAPLFSANLSVNFFGARAFGNGGSFYYGMESGDFNGDGKIDILTCSYNNILVFYGDGKGEFSLPPVTAFSSSSGGEIFPVVGDFNNDGRTDIAFTRRNPANNAPSIAVIFGKADRSFSSPNYSSQEPAPAALVPIDFDNDGKLDLLGQAQTSNSNAIVFYKGNGNNTFVISGQLNTVYPAGGISTGDLNNDGLQDISYSDSESLKVSQNMGNGSFGTPIAVDSIDYGFNSKISDVNNDGKNDIIAVQDTFVDPTVAVWIGNGNFTFTQSPDFTVQSKEEIFLQQISDIDNDQTQDLIFSSANRTIVSKGSGNGTFAQAVSYVDGGGGGLTVRDFNADGWLDIAATLSVEFGVIGSGSFSVLLNLRNGVFASAPAFETGDETKDIAISDFNSDGLKDFVVVNRGGGGGSDKVIILQQTENANLSEENSFNRLQPFNSLSPEADLGLDPYAVVTGDFNRDNKEDIVVVGHGAFGASQNALILTNQGNNSFSGSLFQIGTGDIYDIATGDFNYDGNLDLVTTGYQGVSISFGMGNETFKEPVSYLPAVASAQVTVGDFSNDGKVDIAVVNYNISKIAILTNNGTGTFSNSANLNVSGVPSAVAAADLNSDGKLDLVVSKSNGVSVITGAGNGTFSAEVSYSINSVSATGLSLADFNQDGKIDVALLAGTNNISILMNDGTGGLNKETLWSGGAVLSTIAAGDLNNDAKVDLIFGFTVSSMGYTKILFNFTEKQTAVRKVFFDFDGDGKADESVFRPSDGIWHFLGSGSAVSAVQFGSSIDKLVPADYDGDGKTDVAVYRNGTWYLQRSSLGFTGINFGDANDIPVPADYDGDGRSEIAVFRPSNGFWYIYNLTNNQFTSVQFGQPDDVPLPADYDADGKTDIAVYRQGIWYLNSTQLGFTAIAFGESTDKPVPSDYDGDLKADVAVFRPSNGTWYLMQSGAGFKGFQFGFGTDKPIPADYDGDGKTDIAVFRDGTWYLQRSRDGFAAITFGNSTDKPIPNSFIP